MNGHYLSPGQYSQPQTVQPNQPPNANANGHAQATAYPTSQFDAQASAITSSSSTTTTTQQYDVSSDPQYLQQPLRYLPPAIGMGVGHQQQSSTTGTSHLVQTQYLQNQQPSTVSQPQVSQHPPILQPQLQQSATLQQTQQQLPQHLSMASGMQYSDQSQSVAHQQQQMYQQPQQPSTIDFTQLLVSPPPLQQVPGNDFSQLMQAAPPGSTSSSVVTTTTTRTETYKGSNAGGEARKKAEARGEQEIQRFEEKVQKLIRRICPCPMGAQWYNSPQGYMCAEGIHFLYHEDIDRAFKRPGWIPRVTWVNTTNNPDPQNLRSGLLFPSSSSRV